MKIAIDASNLHDGGGITHLKELLNVFKHYPDHEFLILVGQNSAFETFSSENIKLEIIPAFNGNVFKRNLWLIRNSKKWLEQQEVDILFNPGGGYLGTFKPYVTMSRNMLIFQKEERSRFGMSRIFYKLKLLEIVHSRSLKKANGIIFISKFAENYISKILKFLPTTTIIPHGVSDIFDIKNKAQFPIENYSTSDPFKFLYVSIIDFYKHHCEVAEAIAMVRNEGYPVEITFVGGANPHAYKELALILDQIDPTKSFIHYVGKRPYENLNQLYNESNAIIFASSCENMPNILIEGMKSGLPIACSDRQPMPEFLKDAGYYFDPDDKNSIYLAVKSLMDQSEKRTELAKLSKVYSNEYQWEKCGQQTIDFIRSFVTNTNS